MEAGQYRPANYRRKPMLYNIQVELWETQTGTKKVYDGHLIDENRDIVARFRDNEHAREVLTEAGFRESSPNIYEK